jgi:molecular chaperone GrpE
MADEELNKDRPLTAEDEGVKGHINAENNNSTLERRIAELEELNADLQDKFLRKHADYENYRKRMVKEKGEAIAYANADLMKEMLEVLDNFERAEKSALETNDSQAIKQGIEMISSNLLNTLTKRGLTKIETIGHPFNPEVHQAIAMSEDEEGGLTEPSVAEEYQSG